MRFSKRQLELIFDLANAELERLKQMPNDDNDNQLLDDEIDDAWLVCLRIGHELRKFDNE